MNYGGTAPLDENGLAARVKHAFQMATGKPLGVSMLRHSYITHMRRGEMPVYEQQKMAAAMCHSSAMSQMYRKI
jgi:site-specific recombinase XerD